MSDKRFDISNIDRLRSPERLERLEVDRVIDLILSDRSIQSIADIGTGSGLFAEAFHNRNIQVEGIDVSKEMVNAASTLVPDAMFIVAPAESLPWEDKSFDAVFLGMVLHETDNPLEALKEANRVAREQVIILEWPDEEQDFGPPRKDRLSSNALKHLADLAGLQLENEVRLQSLVLYWLQSLQRG